MTALGGATRHMWKKLFVGSVAILGVAWVSFITYLYFFYDAGPKAPGAMRREDQINEFVLKFNQGTFLDKNAPLHREAEGPYLGFRAPDFELEDLQNNKVRLSELRDKPILLNFWASWCPPCRKEMPDLQEFANAYREKIHVVGVNWNDQLEEVKKFLSEYGVTFINLLDTNGKIFVRYGLTGLPTSFFIDEAGIIRGKWLGSMTREDMLAAFRKTTRAFDQEGPSQ